MVETTVEDIIAGAIYAVSTALFALQFLGLAWFVSRISRDSVWVVVNGILFIGTGFGCAYALISCVMVSQEHLTQKLKIPFVVSIGCFAAVEYCYMTYSYIRSKDVVAHISRRCVFPVKLLWFCSPFAFISEIIASALVAFWSDSHLPDQQAIALWAYFVSMVTTGFIVLLYDAMLLVCFLLYLAKMRKRGDSISTEDVKFTTIAWHGTFGCVSVFAVICLVTAGFLQHGLDTPYSNVFLSLIALTSSAICLNMIVLKIRLHYQRISDKPSSVENTYGLKEKLRNVLTELNHSMSTSATMKDTSSNK